MRKLIANGYMRSKKDKNGQNVRVKTKCFDSGKAIVILHGQLNRSKKKIKGIGRRIGLVQLKDDDGNAIGYDNKNTNVSEGQFSQQGKLTRFGRRFFADGEY